MKIVYISLTGNVEKFVNKLENEKLEIISGEEEIKGDFVVVTNTMDYGELDFALEEFLDEHESQIKGVAASGQRGYGNDFAISADVIAKKYRVPIIHKFEDEGTENDVQIVKEFIESL